MARFKYLMAILLTIISTSAMAEWTLIAEYDDFDFFINKASIHKNGNIAKMWSFYDFKSPQKANRVTYLSKLMVEKYDCVEGKLNGLSTTIYAKNKQKGEIVRFDHNNKSWELISPGSLGEKKWKTACGK